MKFFGKTVIYTSIIFVIIFLFNLVINPGKIRGIFEKGIIPGIGLILSALVLLCLVAFIASFIGSKLRARS